MATDNTAEKKPPRVFINPDIPSLAPSYPAQLADDTKAYIRRSEEFPKVTCNDPLEGSRIAYNRFCAEIDQHDVPNVTERDFSLPGPADAIRLREYTPPNPRHDAEMLFFHGGGFYVGDLDTHNSICRKFAAEGRIRVTAVDYRLAPEHRFPAAFEDALAAYNALRTSRDTPIILCGDSAGGTLSAAVSAHCQINNIPKPRGQLLIYPYLGGDPTAGSYQRHRDAPLLTLEEMQKCADLYYGENVYGENVYGENVYGENVPINDHRAMPLQAFRFAGLPPTAILVTAIDPIADDGTLYANRLRLAAVPCLLHTAPSLPHGVIRAWNQIAEVADCWHWMIAALEQLIANTIPVTEQD